MMNEGNASAEISCDHAILLFTENSSNSVVDYVKAISKIIGSSQIHSVYNFGNHIKVYVKDKKCVSAVINAGVTIKSCHTKAEFAVHPSSKVILLDVDPIIPDACIKSILKTYGMLESSIIHQKFALEEYCNIENGVRFVYMKLFEGKTVPNELSLKYEDKCYKVHVKVESNSELNKHKVSSGNEKRTNKHKVSLGNEMCTNVHKVSSGNEMCTNIHKVFSGNEMCTNKPKVSSMCTSTHKVSSGNEMCTSKHKVSSGSELCTVKNYVSGYFPERSNNKISSIKKLRKLFLKKRIKRKKNETASHIQKTSTDNNAILHSECCQQNNMCYNNIFFLKQSMNLEDNIRVASTQSSKNAINDNCQVVNLLTQLEAVESKSELEMLILTPEACNFTSVTSNCDYDKLACIYDTSTLYHIARHNDLEAYLNSFRIKSV